ncbi:MAG: glycosyltransferase [Candidatus Kapaibacterium sp.]
MIKHKKIISIYDYEKFTGGEIIERLEKKAKKLENLHVTHINSTYYGGGVSEMLQSLTILMNNADIETGWRIIQGSPDFFSVTKKFHNAIQGGQVNMTERKKQIFEDVVAENALRNHIDHDFVFVHDPQPLPLIEHYRKRGPWVWQSHIDMSNPQGICLDYLKRFINKYDAIIASLEEYRLDIDKPQRYFLPAIDPFSIKNRDFREDEVKERLEHHNIPTDLPIVAQISRFDKWKDPEGVIEAFKKARKEIDATLVLLGNVATDDPEGEDVYSALLDQQEDRILILSREDTSLVNALQCRADVILQKSLSEGFGLTVTEAMWKKNPVIGGNTGGIKKQIVDGENGFLVNNTDEAAERIVYLIKNPKKRKEMGEKANKTVKEKFLMTRLLEQYFDLMASFKTSFTLE